DANPGVVAQDRTAFTEKHSVRETVPHVAGSGVRVRIEGPVDDVVGGPRHRFRRVEVVTVQSGPPPGLVDAGVSHVVTVGEEYRRAVRPRQIRPVPVVDSRSLNNKPLAAARGGRAKKDGKGSPRGARVSR